MVRLRCSGPAQDWRGGETATQGILSHSVSMIPLKTPTEGILHAEKLSKGFSPFTFFLFTFMYPNVYTVE